MDWEVVITDILVLIPDLLKLPIVTGGGFFSILISIPAMVQTLLALRRLELDSVALYNTLQAIPRLASAIEEAKASGDTSQLEALFGRPKTLPLSQ